MKFSILFKSLEVARKARRELVEGDLLRWNDLTSLHHRCIRVDQLPLHHTSARRGALLGAVLVGTLAALVLAAVAANHRVGFGVGAAMALGAGAGLLYGGIFGAIAYSTRPAPFIREKLPDICQDGALLVCDIGDPRRAERVRERLERSSELAIA